ncbi:TonB-dependent receptor [Sphingobium sp. HWE2-09]|uniref:TonB-dependent receptor n=1 Tax=Sphingobium sp. HWE2-09 TaxID=3108390 RepID=UPI002DD3FE80|nr:TonB-dependent receptor [Sphingobium sp. HWE2-09]
MTDRFQQRTIWLCSTAFLVMAVPGVAHAEQDGATVAQDRGSSDLDIIVTANKREQALIDVPMTVNVATGAQLEKNALFNFEDIDRLAPGLEINDDGRNTTTVLRGISFDPDIGGPNTIGVYFNEVPIDINAISVGTFDVQQIEVLRGPQGVLRGRTAPAGAITLTTRRANLSESEGQVRGSLTDKGGRNVQGGVSVPLIADKLALRIAGLIDRTRGNFVRNVTNGERSSGRTNAIRATLSFAPTEKFSGSVVYQYSDNLTRQATQVAGTGNRPSLLSPFVSGPAISPFDRQGVQEAQSTFGIKTHIVTTDLNFDLGNHDLRFVGGFIRNTGLNKADLDSGNAVQNYSQFLTVPIDSKEYTGELRLDSKMDGIFNYTVGLFYNKVNNRGISHFDVTSFYANAVPRTPFPAAMASLPLLADVNIINNTSDLAAFGNARFDFTDKLHVEVGARYTINKARAVSFLTVRSTGGVGFLSSVPAFVNPNNQQTVDPAFVKQKNEPLTGMASVTYEWTPDLTTYFNYGRSYRRGSAALGVTSTLDSSLLVIKPERSDAFEVGIKSRLFDRRLSISLAAYYQKFDGFIGRNTVRTSAARNGVVDSGPFGINFNGDAVTKGVEAEIAARVNDNFDLNIGASYNKANYTDALAPCNDFNFDGIPDTVGTPAVPVGQQVSFCVLNTRLNDNPNFSLTANGDIHFPVGPVESFLRWNYKHRPSVAQQGTVPFTTPAQNRVDLFAGVRGGDNRWEVSLFVRNVLNERKLLTQGAELQATTSYLVRQPAGSPPSPSFLSGYRAITVSPPRELGISASFNF